jgi:DNA-3-methyladenine glycosylase II
MKLDISPEAPYNFELSTKIISNGDPQIQKYENGTYWQVIRLKNNLILFIIKSVGTVDDPKLSVHLKPDVKLGKEDIILAREMINSVFNLKFKLKDFYNHIRKDRIISKLTVKLRGLNSLSTPTLFEAIVSSIIEQQISLKVAKSIEQKIIKRYGDPLKLENKIYYGFPTPITLSKLEREDLRRCGLSYRKAEYIIGLAKCMEERRIDLDKLKNMKSSDIIQKLLKIRGIGLWTAELAVLRGLHKMDAIPADDIGLRRIVSHYYNHAETISGDELRIISKNWGDWSGLAAFYLIVADLLSIKI